MSDRKVHATSPHQTPAELVRYDRAGKWYFEWKGHRRRRLTIDEAVDFANVWQHNGGTVSLGLPGGRRFDSMLRERLRRDSS